MGPSAKWKCTDPCWNVLRISGDQQRIKPSTGTALAWNPVQLHVFHTCEVNTEFILHNFARKNLSSPVLRMKTPKWAFFLKSYSVSELGFTSVIAHGAYLNTFFSVTGGTINNYPIQPVQIRLFQKSWCTRSLFSFPFNFCTYYLKISC